MSIFSRLPGGTVVDTILNAASKKPVANSAVTEALEGLEMLSGAGAPTTATAGVVGQEYYDMDAEKFYKCVAYITDGDGTLYTWVSVSANDNSAEFGTRGPVIFASSGTFNIADYGLKVGDTVNVVCVGGGGGGGGAAYMGGSGTPAGRSGGYGSGGNGGAGGYVSSYVVNSGGGGGSGYVKQATVVLNEEEISVTIGAGGSGATTDNDGGDGGTTSFGSLLNAAGGAGGVYGTKSSTYTEGGIGGAGVTVAGQSAITTTSEASIQGAGVVFIWY